MKKGDVTGLEAVKRTDTAELRRRYGDITCLLGEGYNHKQICEHLNKQGVAIPYAQYRAIMTRLRREKGATGNPALSATPSIVPVREARTAPVPNSVVPPASTEKPYAQDTQGKKIFWDPMSKVKWK